jgi:hypothetical protein
MRFRLWTGGLAAGLISAATLASAGTAAPAADRTAAAVIISPPQARLLGDPRVPRPGSTPCVVTLYQDVLLSEDNQWTHAYTWTPPAACQGPWQKVVLEADYDYDDDENAGDSVAAGIWLNGVNLHFGGRPLVAFTGSPGYVERDVTDYTALLKRSASGAVVLDPSVTQQFANVAFVRTSARILVYPVTANALTPRKPDAVYPIVVEGTRPNQMTLLRSGFNTLSSTLSLPRNVERAYLDLLLFGGQYAGGGWLWWSCAPQGVDLPNLLPPREVYFQQFGNCNNGTFREAEISIDGEPAGVAPIAPWITRVDMLRYDSFYLSPEPVHSINLMPYRVDLTPFAGVLSDGRPHQVAVTVVKGSPDPGSVQFEAAATLLVYRNAGTAIVSGAVTRNTLMGQAAEPTVVSTLQNDGDATRGRVTTTLHRTFTIEGFIVTSRGRVDNRVAQTVDFSTVQRFDNVDSAQTGRYQQEVQLLSSAHRISDSTLGAQRLRHDDETASFPVYAYFRDAYLPASPYVVLHRERNMRQGLHLRGVHSRAGQPQFSDSTNAVFDSDSQADYDSQGYPTASSTQGARTWTYGDNRGSCYSGAMASSNFVIPAFEAGSGCPGERNAVHWFAHPDGSPESVGWMEAR